MSVSTTIPAEVRHVIRRPRTAQALRFDGTNESAVAEFVARHDGAVVHVLQMGNLLVQRANSSVTFSVRPGDWVVAEPGRDMYAVSDSAFAAMFMEVGP